MIKNFEKLINPLVIIVAAVGLRLLPHMPNFTPIGAMALFGGAYLDKRLAMLLPLSAMIVSDLFIGFYSPAVMLSVYGSFVLIGLIGVWLRRRKSPKNILLASYIMGIPFFRGTFLGDFFYTGLFFGGYELAKYLILGKKLALAKI